MWFDEVRRAVVGVERSVSAHVQYYVYLWSGFVNKSSFAPRIFSSVSLILVAGIFLALTVSHHDDA